MFLCAKTKKTINPLSDTVDESILRELAIIKDHYEYKY